MNPLETLLIAVVVIALVSPPVALFQMRGEE